MQMSRLISIKSRQQPTSHPGRHFFPGDSSCILACSQNADESSGINKERQQPTSLPGDISSRETPSAFWPAPKMQLSRLVSIKRDSSPRLFLAEHFSPGDSICILACSQNAYESPGINKERQQPTSLPGRHFVPGDSICILACFQNADESSGINEEGQQPTSLLGDISSRETPSAFWPAPKMQMSRLISIKRDSSPHLFLATFLPGRLHLHFGLLIDLPDDNSSAFPSAVEKHITCTGAARKPPHRQARTHKSLLKLVLVKA